VSPCGEEHPARFNLALQDGSKCEDPMVCGKEQSTHAAFGMPLGSGKFKHILGLALRGQLVHDRFFAGMMVLRGQYL